MTILIAGPPHLGRPYLIDNDGTWVMIYRNGATHQPAANSTMHIRFSTNEGASWTADDTFIDANPVVGFPIQGPIPATDDVNSAILIRAPNGDLLCLIWEVKADLSASYGTHQYRSTDDGASWSDEGYIAGGDSEVCAAEDSFIDGTDIYVGAAINIGSNFTSWKSALYKSTNNGTLWTKVSDITIAAEQTGEAGIEHLGGNNIIAVLRDNNAVKTYQRKSTDMGASWGALEDKTGQLGIFHRPRILTFNDRLELIGRQQIVATHYTARFYSKDDGISWIGPQFPDPTGYVDAGYCSMLMRNNNDFYVLSYAGGASNDTDIMEYIFAPWYAYYSDRRNVMIC